MKWTKSKPLSISSRARGGLACCSVTRSRGGFKPNGLSLVQVVILVKQIFKGLLKSFWPSSSDNSILIRIKKNWKFSNVKIIWEISENIEICFRRTSHHRRFPFLAKSYLIWDSEEGPKGLTFFYLPRAFLAILGFPLIGLDQGGLSVHWSFPLEPVNIPENLFFRSRQSSNDVDAI